MSGKFQDIMLANGPFPESVEERGTAQAVGRAIRANFQQFQFLKSDPQQRPKITEHPKDAVAAKDEPLTLNCKATGRPPPEFIWYQNGVPLSPSDRRVILPEGSLFFLR
uniref:Ig-like domain-containing protein n=1 Tax=Anopheles melas TaxID=34690 RepID=A0A182U684_9DIPT